jgi:hypothetical protein
MTTAPRSAACTHRFSPAAIRDALRETLNQREIKSFPMTIVRPHVDGGVAWDRLFGLTQSVKESIATESPTVVNQNTTAGFVLGGGVDIHVKIHIMPELRYTRWGSAQFADPTGLLHSIRTRRSSSWGLCSSGCGTLREVQLRADYPVRPRFDFLPLPPRVLRAELSQVSETASAGVPGI